MNTSKEIELINTMVMWYLFVCGIGVGLALAGMIYMVATAIK